MKDATAPALDRSRPPAAAPSRPCAFPRFRHERLESGASLWTLDVPDRNLVTVTLLVPGGSELDPPHLAGLASFTAGLRGKGTTHRTALEFAAAAEDLGTAVSSSCSWDIAGVGTTMRSEDVTAGLELVAEAALEPLFEADEIERARRRRLAEIERRRSDPASLAGAAFARAVYDETPYGNQTIGDRESTQAITRSDIAAFHDRALAARSCHLIAVGELGPDRLRRAIEDKIERPLRSHAREFKDEPARLEPDQPERPTRQIVIVDRPGAAQTELRIGHVGVPRSHPDRVPIQVANSILGGKFMSRLNLNLRERHGYTYGVSSRFSSRRGPGPFVVGTAVANEVAGAACREIVAELERLCSEPPSAAELDDARNYLVGVFPYTMQTIQNLSSRLKALATFDLDHDEYERWPERIRATTREQVREVCRRHLFPDRLTITAVGPASELEPQLEDL
ncbi:MAG: pitrilysin family protein [Acidobacteria bacterium]|nr:pitrilysin family protein [Acidobacteriota bacterium]MCY3965987.1 pitrilysin family protein [Acidobacteriota bacterium]